MSTSSLLVDRSIAEIHLLLRALTDELGQCPAEPIPPPIGRLKMETVLGLRVLLPKLEALRRVEHGPAPRTPCLTCDSE
jgi:hypothetical protein